MTETTARMKITDIWQDYECPHGSVDFDLTGNDMVCAGEKLCCSHCRGYHTAGSDANVQLNVSFENGDLRCFPLPADADEKRALLALIGAEVVLPDHAQVLRDMFLSNLDRLQPGQPV